MGFFFFHFFPEFGLRLSDKAAPTSLPDAGLPFLFPGRSPAFTRNIRFEDEPPSALFFPETSRK
jgi:hypothetical protein